MPPSPSSLCRQDLAVRALRTIGLASGPPPGAGNRGGAAQGGVGNRGGAAQGGGASERTARFLDIGTGEGELLVRLARLGFSGDAIDISDAAIEKTRQLLSRKGIGSIDVRLQDLLELPDEAVYDLVLAFEVLEHVEDDVAAMAKACSLLRTGGHLIMSVPAHQALWGPTDVLAGHHRRYEGADLDSRLRRAGLEPVARWSVGVPVLNVLKPLRDRVNARRLRRGAAGAEPGATMEERTKASGLARVIGAADWMWRLAFNRVTLIPVFMLQRLFLRTDLGQDYLVIARRPGA